MLVTGRCQQKHLDSRLPSTQGLPVLILSEKYFIAANLTIFNRAPADEIDVLCKLKEAIAVEFGNHSNGLILTNNE